MRQSRLLLVVFLLLGPGVASAAEETVLKDFTGHWAAIAAVFIFCLAYALVIAEESIHLRKSKPRYRRCRYYLDHRRTRLCRQWRCAHRRYGGA